MALFGVKIRHTASAFTHHGGEEGVDHVCVYRNNHFFESFYPKAVEYPMNTRIELGENYMEMGKATEFFMTVNDSYVTDVDGFIKDYDLERDQVMLFLRREKMKKVIRLMLFLSRL